MPDDLEKKGLEVRARLWGEASLEPGNRYLREFDEYYATLVNDQLFGSIWNRPGLPLKTRSMITLAALMALGRSPELKLHMNGALGLGITPEEIKELIIHVTLYSGFPTGMEAIRVFNEVTGQEVTASGWSKQD
jgi:4-carboxymuconolactone decarboxylase